MELMEVLYRDEVSAPIEMMTKEGYLLLTFRERIKCKWGSRC